jgi:hypothetical protein
MRSEGDAAMDLAIIDEILEELSSALQRVEAQSTAILELIKKKGIVEEDELAPYLQWANEASSVRWRATRVRIGHLLSGLEKREQQAKDERKEKEERKEKTAQSASEKTKTAKQEDAEQPTQKQDQGELAVQSPKADVSDAQRGHERESRARQQEPSKTGSSKTPEKRPEKADQSNAA